MGDKESTLKALEECCKYAVQDATLSDLDYTAPLVNRLKHRKSEISKNYKGNACNLKLQALKHSCFEFLRQEASFQRILSKLEQYAE